MTKIRLTWDEYFIKQVVAISERSTCPRRNVGALIVKDKRIICTGYNGSVPGQPHCIDVGCQMVDGHCVRTIHAERNCIVQAAKFGISLEGGLCYITDFPCFECLKLLIAVGIHGILYLREYENELSTELISKSSIDVRKLNGYPN